jgi:hypothetical protein
VPLLEAVIIKITVGSIAWRCGISFELDDDKQGYGNIRDGGRVEQRPP